MRDFTHTNISPCTLGGKWTREERDHLADQQPHLFRSQCHSSQLYTRDDSKYVQSNKYAFVFSFGAFRHGNHLWSHHYRDHCRVIFKDTDERVIILAFFNGRVLKKEMATNVLLLTRTAHPYTYLCILKRTESERKKHL